MRKIAICWFAVVSMLVLLPTAWCGESVPGNSTNPAAVQEVLSGKREVANAAWWGFDLLDSTTALQGAINSGASKVIVPNMGREWIVRPIKLANNQELLFDPNVVVVAKKGAFRGKRDYLFSGTEITNVTLRGYRATLKMRKKDYQRSQYPKSEWRHILAFYGCSNINVLGLTLESSGGDGISLGATKDARDLPCRNIRIQDCVCSDNYRQGISVASVDTLRIENCVLSNTKGTPPMAGIDLEPDTALCRLSNVVISNCVSKNNTGPGFQVHLGKLDSGSKAVTVLFVDSYVESFGGDGLLISSIPVDLVPGLIEFRNCTVEGVKYAGLYILDKNSDAVKLRFDNCEWRYVATAQFRSPIDLSWLAKIRRDMQESIIFESCRVYDNRDRPFLRIRGLEGGRSAGVCGDITVYSKYDTAVGGERHGQLVGLQINRVSRTP